MPYVHPEVACRFSLNECPTNWNDLEYVYWCLLFFAIWAFVGIFGNFLERWVKQGIVFGKAPDFITIPMLFIITCVMFVTLTIIFQNNDNNIISSSEKPYISSIWLIFIMHWLYIILIICYFSLSTVFYLAGVIMHRLYMIAEESIERRQRIPIYVAAFIGFISGIFYTIELIIYLDLFDALSFIPKSIIFWIVFIYEKLIFIFTIIFFYYTRGKIHHYFIHERTSFLDNEEVREQCSHMERRLRIGNYFTILGPCIIIAHFLHIILYDYIQNMNSPYIHIILLFFEFFIPCALLGFWGRVFEFSRWTSKGLKVLYRPFKVLMPINALRGSTEPLHFSVTLRSVSLNQSEKNIRTAKRFNPVGPVYDDPDRDVIVSLVDDKEWSKRYHRSESDDDIGTISVVRTPTPSTTVGGGGTVSIEERLKRQQDKHNGGGGIIKLPIPTTKRFDFENSSNSTSAANTNIFDSDASDKPNDSISSSPTTTTIPKLAIVSPRHHQGDGPTNDNNDPIPLPDDPPEIEEQKKEISPPPSSSSTPSSSTTTTSTTTDQSNSTTLPPPITPTKTPTKLSNLEIPSPNSHETSDDLHPSLSPRVGNRKTMFDNIIQKNPINSADDLHLHMIARARSKRLLPTGLASTTVHTSWKGPATPRASENDGNGLGNLGNTTFPIRRVQFDPNTNTNGGSGHVELAPLSTITHSPSRSRNSPTPNSYDRYGNAEIISSSNINNNNVTPSKPLPQEQDHVVELAEQQICWFLHPNCWKVFFSYPNPINVADQRISSSIMTFILLLSLFLEFYINFIYLKYYITYFYIIRFICGIRLEPLSMIIILYIRPFLVNKMGYWGNVYMTGLTYRVSDAVTGLICLLLLYLNTYYVYGILFILIAAHAAFDVNIPTVLIFALHYMDWLPLSMKTSCEFEYYSEGTQRARTLQRKIRRMKDGLQVDTVYIPGPGGKSKTMKNYKRTADHKPPNTRRTSIENRANIKHSLETAMHERRHSLEKEMRNGIERRNSLERRYSLDRKRKERIEKRRNEVMMKQQGTQQLSESMPAGGLRKAVRTVRPL